jgi:uroporphyrinogen-III decarboxylase
VRVAEGSTRELLLRVFRQQEVDRIPVSPFIHLNHIRKVFGNQDVDWVIRTPEVYARYGFDVIHRNCSVAYDPLGPSGPLWETEITQTRDGRDQTKITLIRTPRGNLRCREELRWVYEYDAEVSLVEFPVQSRKDFERFREFQPPLGPVDVTDISRAKRAVGEAGVVAPWIQGAFNLLAVYYRKIDELLMDALLDADFYHEMMRYFLDRYKGFVQQLIDAGVDVLSAGGNVGNGKMVGPDFFRSYIWPYEKELIDFIQGQGVAVLYHNCGYARSLLHLYPGLGLQAYESLTPPPYGDTVLAEAVEAFGKRTTLLGGIDQLDLLRTGTPREIEATVKRVLDTVRGRCHFILGTTDYFNENTPEEKIRVLADAGHRYGRL